MYIYIYIYIYQYTIYANNIGTKISAVIHYYICGYYEFQTQITGGS